MDDALKQALGGLLLNAVPTILIFFGLYLAYLNLVHKPLLKVLAERHNKTGGAVAKAQSDIAAADSKSTEYEQRLREARAGLFKQQEARRKMVMEAREAALAEARSQASVKVKAAKADLQKEAATAKGSLMAQAEQLANEIIQAVLGTGVTAGGR